MNVTTKITGEGIAGNKAQGMREGVTKNIIEMEMRT